MSEKRKPEQLQLGQVIEIVPGTNITYFSVGLTNTEEDPHRVNYYQYMPTEPLQQNLRGRVVMVDSDQTCEVLVIPPNFEVDYGETTEDLLQYDTTSLLNLMENEPMFAKAMNEGRIRKEQIRALRIRIMP